MSRCATARLHVSRIYFKKVIIWKCCVSSLLSAQSGKKVIIAGLRSNDIPFSSEMDLQKNTFRQLDQISTSYCWCFGHLLLVYMPWRALSKWHFVPCIRKAQQFIQQIIIPDLHNLTVPLSLTWVRGELWHLLLFVNESTDTERWGCMDIYWSGCLAVSCTDRW